MADDDGQEPGAAAYEAAVAVLDKRAREGGRITAGAMLWPAAMLVRNLHERTDVPIEALLERVQDIAENRLALEEAGEPIDGSGRGKPEA